jgi:hypothetical protein
MSKWIDWPGGPCPLPAGTKVNFTTKVTARLPAKLRDELEAEIHDVAELEWEFPRLRHNVSAYRLVEVAK